VLIDKGIYKELLFKLRKEEESFIKLNAIALLLTQTKASRQDALVKDLQPLNRHLLLEKEETLLSNTPLQKKLVQRT
jgi:hypothetical protein